MRILPDESVQYILSISLIYLQLDIDIINELLQSESKNTLKLRIE